MILGFTVAITLGPALFALLQTSIKHGIKIGIFLALGIFASDLLIVVLAFFGVSGIITNPSYSLAFGIIGGIVMEFFGIFTFFRKLPENDQIQVHTEIKVKRPGSLPYFFKGFVLNIANPSLWFFWVTAVVSISSTYTGPHKNELVAFFFFGALATIFMTDILKCVLANQFKILEKPSVKRWVNRIVGILFVIIGIIIISGTFYSYYHHDPSTMINH
ncbi:MAG TPA: LysE family translocator [Bacteroidales bacterium]|nr:LysE family translocator [Bacteroidales bacterium]